MVQFSSPPMSTILIVDDNPMFLSEASKLCQREGFETMTARSWSELNSVLATRVPDLVLMDIEMPSIPGHRLGTFVRARYRIPIVLVSGHSEERLKRLFDASDADGWICKPLTRDKLIAAVTRFMPVLKQDQAEEAAPPKAERVATEESRQSVFGGHENGSPPTVSIYAGPVATGLGRGRAHRRWDVPRAAEG